MRTIFHVDLDAFFVSVERAKDPSLLGKPVVVGGEPGGRGVVTCASYEARPFGLHAGMSLTEAYRLCPQAIYLRGDFDLYKEVSDKFMTILSSYTPWVQTMGLDEAYMDMTGFESLYGPPQNVARTIKDRVRNELHIVVSVGIATSRVVAKVASDAGKPDGLLRVLPGEEAAFLAPRPVRELPGVGEKTAPRFVELGIKTIGQIVTTPPETLRSVLGSWGDVVRRSAQGIDDSPVAGPSAPKSISRETTFHQDTLDSGLLRGTLRYLGERVCAELREHQMLTRNVSLRLRWQDFTTISRQHALPRHVCSDEAVYAVAESLLQRELAIEARGARRKVRLIGIGVSDVKDRGGQLTLLQPERDELLANAVDTIRKKYGYTSVQNGLTLVLRNTFPESHGKYLLKTSALSR